MMNLLTETIDSIKDSGHNIEDVAWVGSPEYGWFSWDEFAALANVTYDNGFGGQEVASDLIVMFTDDQYMTRGEYDGSEWWQFHPPITKPTAHRVPTRLLARIGWNTLTTIANQTDEHWDEED